ncbi:hypothetical protein [Dactylosporangium sp. CA-233914]|uniref:hypothetical protein n=1 Tax=Dactylosporangium sp. CA-233914 TaxID=3239934 RepID=UPI003D9394B4
MIERATGRRLAGDWRGACEAAFVFVDVDLGALRQRHGVWFAGTVEDALRHLIPDLLRWYLPRSPATGLFRPAMTYPLALLRDGFALVALTPASHDPQRVFLRVQRLGHAGMLRDDTLLLLRDRWDSRCTAELLLRCGGLPLFTGTAEAGTTAARAFALDEAGRHAEAWSAAGFDLRVLLFDEEWGRERIDPAAFTSAARRHAAIDASLAWLRPSYTALPAAARRTLDLTAEARSARRTAAESDEPRVDPPLPVDVDEDCGLVRIDLRGRRLVLDVGGARVRLLSRVPYNRVDERRRRAEVREFGVELSRVPLMPLALARRPAELTALLDGDLTPDDLHPVVHATLFPGRPGPTPPPPLQLPGSIRVRCGHATHEIHLRDGGFVTPHTEEEITRERALQALGGERIGCLAAIDSWYDHRVAMPSGMRRLRDQVMLLAAHGDAWLITEAVRRGLDPDVSITRGRRLRDLLAWTWPLTGETPF